MGKILGSWSGMRNYLEREMLAECLQGRVRYDCTSYMNPASHKSMDNRNVFRVFVDGKEAKCFSWETVNTYFIENGLQNFTSHISEKEYWSGFHRLLNSTPMEKRTEYTDEEFCDALKEYRNQNIQASIRSDNPLVRMFAVLDRRIGTRTLSEMGASFGDQPEWLQQFYRFRLDAARS